MIREIHSDELEELLGLYTYLHNNDMPLMNKTIRDIWKDIMEDSRHHIIVAKESNQLISSCVLIIVPNLTHGQRPFGVIENVITHPEYRKMGYAGACLEYAKELGKKAGCYKLMLMTGSKEESTLSFYEKSGYNKKDKTAFIQWLN